jgi:UDP-N-acetylglucosamine 1-carboxyvinyltransferase
MQPQIAVTLGLSTGCTSIIKESIFENRFKYLDELRKMGGNVTVESNIAIIEGVEKYKGASVSAPDLRAGAALVIAALAAEGFSTVDQIHFIERGYEDFPEKLAALGGRIRKVSNPEELQKAKLRVV